MAIPFRLRKLLVFGLSVEAITILHNNHSDALNTFFIEHIQSVEEFDYRDVAIAFWESHPSAAIDIIALACGRYNRRGIKRISRLPRIGKLRALINIGALTFDGRPANIDQPAPKANGDAPKEDPPTLDGMVAEWKAHASLLLSENHIDAHQYPIGRLIDEAFVVNTRKDKELALNLSYIHATLVDVAAMSLGGKKNDSFKNMIARLMGVNNGKAE